MVTREWKNALQSGCCAASDFFFEFIPPPSPPIYVEPRGDNNVVTLRLPRCLRIPISMMRFERRCVQRLSIVSAKMHSKI